MKITASNRSIWLDFFQTAIAFRDMAPWEWMYDSDMFGVQDPDTGEIGYCCIMGAAGEVFALGVYQGKEGFFSYLKLLDADPYEMEDADLRAAALEQKILKVEFVDRDETDKVDRDAFKELGLKFRGSRQWAQARDYQPGYFPWYLSDDKAVFMTHCLQQAMDVAARFREDEDILEDPKDRMLVRVPKKTQKGLVWSDKFLPDPAEEKEIVRKADPFLANRAKKELKKEKTALCFSLEYLPGAMQAGDGEDRPFFARLAFWIAYGSGFIMGMELFSPKSFDDSFDQVFFNQLHTAGSIPQQLIVNSEMAYDAVEPIANTLGMELIMAPELETFSEIKREFKRYFGGEAAPPDDLQ